MKTLISLMILFCGFLMCFGLIKGVDPRTIDFVVIGQDPAFGKAGMLFVTMMIISIGSISLLSKK